MPDPVTGAIVGSTVLSGVMGADAAGDAADAQRDASAAGIAEQRRQFNTALNLQAPAINTGNVARSTLASILGLTVPGQTYEPFAATTAAQPTGGLQVLPRSLGGGGRQPPTQRAPAAGPTLSFNTPASAPISGDGLQKMLEAFPGYRFAVDQATKSAQAMGSATGSLGGNVLTALGERVGGGIAMPTFQSYLDRLEGLSGVASNASNATSGMALNSGNSVASLLQRGGDARASGIMGQAGAGIGTIGGILGAMGQNSTGGNTARYWGDTQGLTPGAYQSMTGIVRP